MKHAVKLVKETDDAYIVGGYGVVWGGRDLMGDHFTKDTDFWFDRLTESPMFMYEHGLDGTVKREVFGHILTKKVDDVGLWIEGQIDKAAEYAEAVMELVKKGVLGLSSGAVSHLAEIQSGGKIVSWPIVEFSLTPDPAEPRTLGVAELEALSASDVAVKALVDKVKALPSTKTVAEARRQLLAARKLHQQHMDGTAPTTGPAGEKSQQKLMDQIEAALAALEGIKSAAPSAALPTEPTPMDGDRWGSPKGTYEHLIDCLGKAARAALRVDPYDCDWAWVIQTYPDYCVVGVDMYSDGPMFYEVAYTLGEDGEPVLGEIREVQRVYLPVEAPPTELAATAMIASYVTRSATQLHDRLRGLHAGRVKEGRVLSTANRERLKAAHEALAPLLETYADLLATTEPKTTDAGAAKALIEVQTAHIRALALAAEVGVPA